MEMSKVIESILLALRQDVSLDSIPQAKFFTEKGYVVPTSFPVMALGESESVVHTRWAWSRNDTPE